MSFYLNLFLSKHFTFWLIMFQPPPVDWVECLCYWYSIYKPCILLIYSFELGFSKQIYKSLLLVIYSIEKKTFQRVNQKLFWYRIPWNFSYSWLTVTLLFGIEKGEGQLKELYTCKDKVASFCASHCVLCPNCAQCLLARVNWVPPSCLLALWTHKPWSDKDTGDYHQRWGPLFSLNSFQF